MSTKATMHSFSGVMIATALLTFACVPASASALTFGADLNQEAVNLPVITCGAGVPNQFLETFVPGTQSQSCLWSSVAVGSPQALTPPAGGTVTAVRVRAGATTGPMQIDVVRFLTSNTATPGQPDVACCFLERYGPVFTPAPNAVTTLPVSLPVQEDAFPAPGDLTTIAANDQLALAVLAPNVPVPVFATRGGAADLGVLSYGWYPAPSAAGGVPAPSPNPIAGFADLSGFQVLMNADLATAGAATGGGAGAGAPAQTGPPAGARPTALPALNLPRQTIPVRGDTAMIPIQCQVLDCTGTLALQNAEQAGAARAAVALSARADGAVARSAAKKKAKPAKLITYGSVRFSVKAGKSATVRVKLNPTGRKLLKRARSAKVWANVKFSAGGGTPKSVRVKLKR